MITTADIVEEKFGKDFWELADVWPAREQLSCKHFYRFSIDDFAIEMSIWIDGPNFRVRLSRLRHPDQAYRTRTCEIYDRQYSISDPNSLDKLYNDIIKVLDRGILAQKQFHETRIKRLDKIIGKLDNIRNKS
jgi:hypothetical protein